MKQKPVEMKTCEQMPIKISEQPKQLMTQKVIKSLKGRGQIVFQHTNWLNVPLRTTWL